MPKPNRRIPEDPGRPTPREAIAKARAAAAPRVAKAVEAATPKVEKAALTAGKLLGTLRERARITAKEFADAYNSDDEKAGEQPAAGARDSAAKDEPGSSSSAGRPRPRPRKE
jgi:hypothetical protein